MALAAIDSFGSVYGFAQNAIDIFGNLQDALFPAGSAASFNNFRVHVGKTERGDEQRSTGGGAPSLALWDVSGRFVNLIVPDEEELGPKLPITADGGFRDYHIEGRQGADYLSVVRNGNDGICISLITGEESGTGRQFMWTGDMGKVCGAPWYLQQKAINNDPNKSYVPACVWIDGNGDSGHLWKGFNMHLSSFIGSNLNDNSIRSAMELEANAWNKSRELLCKSEPRFSLYEDIEMGNQIRIFKDLPSTKEPGTDGYRNLVLDQKNWDWGDVPSVGSLPTTGDSRNSRKIQCLPDEQCPPKGPSWNRTIPIQPSTRRKMRRRPMEDQKLYHIRKRQTIHADNLIVSKLPQHSAVELCESPYSLGPDMVSWTEGMFCDMSEKQLWPVCADSSGGFCFDMDSRTVRGSMGSIPPTEKPLYPNATSASVAPGVAVAVSGSSAGRPIVPNKAYSSVTTWDP